MGVSRSRMVLVAVQPVVAPYAAYTPAQRAQARRVAAWLRLNGFGALVLCLAPED